MNSSTHLETVVFRVTVVKSSNLRLMFVFSDTDLLFEIKINCSRDNTPDIAPQRVESNSSLYVGHYKWDEQRIYRRKEERNGNKKRRKGINKGKVKVKFVLFSKYN
jgi:hypothetical protein